MVGRKDGAKMKPLAWHLEICGLNPETSRVSSSEALPTHLDAGDTVESLLPREMAEVKASAIAQPSDGMRKGDTGADARDSCY